MATIKNILRTISESVGFGKTVNDVNSLGTATEKAGKSADVSARSTTRLGQASASAGRSFSAQSKGLGGLVGAYAGAAATMFALQQGYAALSTAAKSETVIQGTKTLAAQVAQSGPRILKSIHEITQGQLTLTEAATMANTALSAGFDTNQIEQFTEVALKASRALGRDFSDAMQRIIKGSSKMEPELLDELGIFTRIDPAVRAYAKSMGVASTSLTEFQRRQAFANAVISEGTRKFNVIDTTTGSTQKSLEQLRVSLSELTTEFTKVLVAGVKPLVDFFSGDAGNSILLFGALIGTVFKKALSEVGHFSTSSLHTMSKWSASLANKQEIDSAILRSLSTRAGNPIAGRKDANNVTIPDTAGLVGIRDKPYRNQDAAQLKAYKEAVAAQKEGSVRTAAALRAVNIEYERQIKAMEIGLGTRAKNSVAIGNLTTMIELNKKAMDSASKSAKTYIGVADLLKTGVAGLTKVFGFLSTALSGLLWITGGLQILGTIFGVDILGKIQEFFSKSAQASSDFSTGFNGMVIEVAGGSEKLIKSLKQIGLTTEQLDSIPEKLNKLKSGVDDSAATLKASQIQGGATGTVSGGGGMAAAFAGLFGANPYADLVTDADRLVEIDRQLLTDRQQLSDPSIGAERIQQLREEVILLSEIKHAIQAYGTEFALVYGQLAEGTGLTGEKIAASFNGSIPGAIAKSTNSVSMFGIAVGKVGDEFDTASIVPAQKELIENALLVASSTREMEAAAMSGSISQQALGAALVGAKEQLKALNDEYITNKNNMRQSGSASADDIKNNKLMGESIDYLTGKINTLERLEKALNSVQKVYNQLTKTFSSQITAFDTASFDGIISASGKITTDQTEQNNNQLELLFNLAATTAKAAELAGNEQAIQQYMKANVISAEDEVVIRGELNDQATVHETTVKAIAGKYVEITTSLQNNAKELKKQNAIAQLELDKLKSANRILTIEIQIDANNVQSQIDQQMASLKQQQIQANISLIDAKKDAKQITPTNAENQTYDLLKELNTLEKENIEAKYKAEKASIALQKQALDEKYAGDMAALAAQYAMDAANRKAQSDIVRGQAQIFMAGVKNITNSAQVMVDGLDAAFNTGASTLYTSISNALLQSGGPVAGAKTTIAPVIPVDLGMALADFNTAAATSVQIASDMYTASQTALTEQHTASAEKLAKQDAALDDARTADIARNGTELETLEARHQANLLGIAEKGSSGSEKEAKKQESIRKKLRDKLLEFNQAFTDAVKDTLTNVISFAKDLITTSMAGNVEALKSEEDTQTQALAITTQMLTDAQGKYNTALEEEVSLRDSLITLTKELNTTQQEYLDTIGVQNTKVAETGAAYVTKLLEQKKAILQVDAATRKSVALGKETKTLQELQIEQEQALANITEARIAAEERLANTDALLSGALELVDIQANSLVGSLQKLAEAMAAAEQISGMVPSNFSAGEVLNSAFGDFEATINDISDIMKEFKPIGDEMTATLNGVTGAVSINSDLFTKIGKGLEYVSSALQGFSIGSTIAGLVGDTGLTTKIGGALGNVVGKILTPMLSKTLAPLITKALSGLIKVGSAALTTALGVAIPIIGSIVGSLLGSLLAKKPRASSTGEFKNGEYTTTSLMAKGGASTETAKALDSIPKAVLTNLSSQLESLGVTIKDVIKTSVYMKKGTIRDASLTMNGKTQSGSSFADAEALAKWFTEAFFKGISITKDSTGAITFRTLLVDALTPNAEDLQGALDNFAQKNVNDKTQDAFNAAIKAANSFNSDIIKLQGSGETLTEIFKTMQDAAVSNARSLISYYKTFLETTETTFGKASAQYAEATNAVKANALAQLGLKAVLVGTAEQMVEISSKQNNNDIGRIVINNIVTSADAMVDVLKYIGYSTTAALEIVAQSISTQIHNTVTAISESLADAIALLENPANDAITGLKSIIDNGAARLDQIQGQLDEIVSTNAGNISRSVTTTTPNPQAPAAATAKKTDGISSLFSLLGGLSEVITGKKSNIATNNPITGTNSNNLADTFLSALVSSLPGFSSVITGSDTKTGSGSFIQPTTNTTTNATSTTVTTTNAINTTISAEDMAIAQQNVLDAERLTQLELASYIKSLSVAQLEAISSTGGFSDSIQALIDEQLALTKAMQQQQAFKELVDYTKDFNSAINDITGQVNKLVILDEVNNIIAGAAVDAYTLSKDLERTNGTDEFTRSLQNMLAHIATGSNVQGNFTDAIALINTEYENGTKDSLNYAKALSTLGETTTNYLSYLNDLESQYKDTTAAIAEVLAAAKDSVTNTLSELETAINNAANTMATSAQTIVSTYDSLQKSITDSSNSIFDIQEKALKSYEDAKNALKDFDATHNLSGRSSAELASELANVQSQIASIVDNPMDVNDFLNVAQLNNERTRLQNEISNLTKLEEDRKALTDSLTTAEADKLYVDNLIANNSALIDTRSTESQVIQDANAALETFNTSTADLAAVTNALTTANFDLAAARVSEETSINKVTDALAAFNTAQEVTVSLMSELANSSSFVERASTAARNSALEFYNSLSDSDKVTALAAAGVTDYSSIQAGVDTAVANITNSARDAALALQNVGLSLSSGADINWTQVPTDISAAIAALTNAFSPANASQFSAFLTALDNINTVTSSINSSPELLLSLSQYNSELASSSTNLGNLVYDFTELNSTLAYLIGTNGSLASVGSAIDTLALNLQKAWEDVKFNTGVAIEGNLQVTAVVQQSSSSSALSSADSSSLTTIASKAGKFPKFKELTPEGTVVQFAKGGEVSGPGTGTSDSIPARLSDGEFVIKAKSASKIGAEVLNFINNNGTLPNSVNTNIKNMSESSSITSMINPSVDTKGLGYYDSMGEEPVNRNSGTSTTDQPAIATISIPKAVNNTNVEMPDIHINFIDKTSGNSIVGEVGNKRREGKNMVIDVILEDVRLNGPITKSLKRINN